MPVAKKTRKTSAASKLAADVLKPRAEAMMQQKREAVKVKAEKTVSAATPDYYVVIDHPQSKEVVSGLHYAIRIGATDAGYVEVQFDDGDWIPCRPSAGYWWLDWGYFTPGTHKIVARLLNNEGKTLKKSTVTKCTVE